MLHNADFLYEEQPRHTLLYLLTLEHTDTSSSGHFCTQILETKPNALLPFPNHGRRFDRWRLPP